MYTNSLIEPIRSPFKDTEEYIKENREKLAKREQRILRYKKRRPNRFKRKRTL